MELFNKYLNRDFSCESFGNMILRAFAATKGRFIGWVLIRLSFFINSKSKGLYFRTLPIIINSKSIFFGDNVHFGRCSRIESFCLNEGVEHTRITIGDNTSFGDYFHIGAVNRICIGNNVLVGSKVLIIDHNHGKPKDDMMSKTNITPRNRPVVSNDIIVINDNVWIGDNAVILQGSKIGFGAIIPANSIVKGVVESFTIYKG